MILEGIVTTVGEDGQANISPMGPIVENETDWSQFLLRPFQLSTTFRNLQRNRQGVLHVTDDVELFARAVVDDWSKRPLLQRAEAVEGFVLAEACRWHAFRVESIDDHEARATMECRTVDQGRLRDFFGFNRAKHAVLEAAILATRLHLLPREQVQEEFRHLRGIVQKTAGHRERRAFALLAEYVGLMS